MLLYFYAFIFYAFYFSIHYHVYVMFIFLLSTWTLYLVFKTLIKENPKKCKYGLGYISLCLETWTRLLFPLLGVLDLLDLGLETVTLDLDLWISLSTVVTLPKFCLKSLEFIPRHWFILFMCRCYFELKKISFCNKDLAQSIECLIGNVVPLVAYVQKSKEWEFQVD